MDDIWSDDMVEDVFELGAKIPRGKWCDVEFCVLVGNAGAAFTFAQK